MMATDVSIPLNFHDNSINFFRNWPTTTNNVVYIQKKKMIEPSSGRFLR